MSKCTRVCAQLSILLLLPFSASAETESWYTYWGLGFASITYPEDENQSIQQQRKQPGVSTASFSLDVLGFYWPLESGGNSIVGVIINGAGERFTQGSDWSQTNFTLYSASAMHFFGAEPGDGFYIRGDLGLARVGSENSDGISHDRDPGMGALIGVGYGIPVSEETRVLININNTYRRIEGDSWNVVGFTVGGLF